MPISKKPPIKGHPILTRAQLRAFYLELAQTIRLDFSVIAKRVGISRTTVAGVLKNIERHFWSNDTEDRVFEAIKTDALALSEKLDEQLAKLEDQE